MKGSPLSDIATNVLAEQETSSMRLVNRVRYLVVLLISGPVILTSAQSGNHTGVLVNLGSLLAYLAITIWHTRLIHRGQIEPIRRFNYIALFADFVLIFGNTIYWGLVLSPTDFSFVAKTPAWFYIAAIIAATVLQFDRRMPYLAIALFAVAYLVVLAIMFSLGVQTTSNWVEYVNGPRIDIGDLVFTKPVVFTILGLVAAYTIHRSLSMVDKITAAELNRSLLSRYFSPSVVEDITGGGSEITRGRRQKVTVLFLDIRNFTRMSERLNPDLLIDWLSDFRARLTSLVFQHKGSVDKFIGDAIMATFGTPRPAPTEGEDSANAVSCALAMLAACQDLDDKWSEHAIRNEIGIGIHTGEVFAGNIGDSDQIEYTVIGDAVNTASRIESLCKKLGRPLIVSDAIQAEVGDRFPMVRLPRVKVKGKEEPLQLYAIEPAE